MATRTQLVALSEIHSAISAIEHDAHRGTISAAEASQRINDSRRAVTPRELWKASGGRAGAKKRGDWWDIRNTALGVAFLVVLAAIGVWIVTIYTGKAVGGEDDYIPEPSRTAPADQNPEEPGGGRAGSS